MKKQKLKILLLFSSLVFLGMVFDSCQFDDSIETKQNLDTTNLNFKLERVKFNKLSKNSKLIKQLSKIDPNKRQNEYGKTVSSSDGSFTINTEFATYIESDNGKHSYTFKIQRDSSQFLLENLVLSLNDSLSYDMYITRYNISQPEYLMLKNGETLNLSNKTSIISFKDESILSNIFNKEDYNSSNGCLLDVTYMPGANCTCEGHSYGESCSCDNGPIQEQWVYTWGACPEIVVIGGNSSSGGGAVGGNDSAYDGSDPNIHGNGGVSTAPTLEEVEEEIIEDPCESLKNLSKPDKYNINPIVDSLKQKVINRVKKEWGTEFIRESYYDALADENVVNYSTNLRVGLNYDIFLASGEEYNALNHVIKYLGGIHLHPLDGYSMFSWGDLKYLMGMYENSSSSYKPEISLLLVCYNHVDPSKPHVYAIRVENINVLKNKINEQWNHSDYSGITNEKKKTDIINDRSSKQYEANKNDLERFFLQKYKDFGISFYKAEDDMSNWNKKSLGSGTGSTQIIVDTPCNL